MIKSMDSDRGRILVLAVFMFLLSFKPSEPHLTRYLEDKGFTHATINNEIYPVWTYAYLPLLVVFGPLADVLPAHFVVAAGCVARVGTRFLLLYGSSLSAMVAAEILYAAGSVSEVVFAAVTVAAVPRARYQVAVSATQSAYLCGHVLAGVLGDASLAAGAPLTSLLWASAASVSAAAVLSVALIPRLARRRPPTTFPPPAAAVHADAATRSLIASDALAPPSAPHARARGDTEAGSVPQPAPAPSPRRRAAAAIAALRAVAARPGAVALVVWFALAGGAYQIPWAYETSLYRELYPATGGTSSTRDLSGSVLALATLAGAGTAWIGALPAAHRLLSARKARAAALAAASAAGGLLLALILPLSRAAPGLALGAFVAYTAVWQFQQAVFVAALARLSHGDAAGAEVGDSAGADATPGDAGAFATVYTAATLAGLGVQTLLQAGLFSWLALRTAESVAVCGLVTVLAAVPAVVSGCRLRCRRRPLAG